MSTFEPLPQRIYRDGRQRLLNPSAGQPIAEPGLTTDRVHVDRAPAPHRVAASLGLPASTPVLVRSRTYRYHGRPVQAATSYIPAHLAAGTRIAHTDTGPGGIHARLAQPGHTPTPEEVAALKLTTPEQHVVLHLWRTATTATGIPVDVTMSVLAADTCVLTDSFTAEEPGPMPGPVTHMNQMTRAPPDHGPPPPAQTGPSTHHPGQVSCRGCRPSSPSPERHPHVAPSRKGPAAGPRPPSPP